MHYQQDTVTPAKVFDDGVYMYAGNYFMGVPGSNMSDLLDVNKLRQAWSISIRSMPRRISAIRPA
jgi:hypothetical protein